MPIARSIRLALLVPLLASLPGCIVLPIPNSRVEGTGIHSQIVDAEDGHPIPGATVTDARDNQHTVTSGAEGRFQLPPVVRWHFGYLFGPVSYPIWPDTGDVVVPNRSVRVTAAGYDPVTFDISPSPEPGDDDIKLKGDVFTIPSLSLRRTPTTKP